MLDRGSCQAAETLLVAGVVAALALLLAALLPGPRIPQVVILLVGGVLIGPEVLGWADRPAIDLLANVGERRSARSVPQDRRAPRHHPTERQLQPRGSDRWSPTKSPGQGEAGSHWALDTWPQPTRSACL